MKKRSLRAIVIWDVALVGGPLVIGLILTLNGWTWANFRLALLAMYAVELFLMLLSGWGPDTLRVRGRSYASVNATAFDDVYGPPDPSVVEEAEMTSGIRDPIAVGPGLALAIVLLSFAVAH